MLAQGVYQVDSASERIKLRQDGDRKAHRTASGLTTEQIEQCLRDCATWSG